MIACVGSIGLLSGLAIVCALLIGIIGLLTIKLQESKG